MCNTIVWSPPNLPNSNCSPVAPCLGTGQESVQQSAGSEPRTWKASWYTSLPHGPLGEWAAGWGQLPKRPVQLPCPAHCWATPGSVRGVGSLQLLCDTLWGSVAHGAWQPELPSPPLCPTSPHTSLRGWGEPRRWRLLSPLLCFAGAALPCKGVGRGRWWDHAGGCVVK